MKDKEKHIEEMARKVCQHPRLKDFYKTCKECNNGGDCYIYNLCKKLSEYYQPKLPKDSVVLTREEYGSKLQDAYDNGVEFGKEWGSKESVEKFANEVYKELYQLGRIYALPETLDADKYGIFSLTQEVIAKIAKEQFGVEIKE